jgi:hypothetical protein
MHPQLHEPDSTRQIETVVDGQTVRGTVILTGSSRMRVTLDWPSTILSAGKSMSFFSRVPPGEPQYLGKFGETLAMNLLLSVYEEYKKGDWRRQFVGARFKEFGSVRYLAVNPGYPGRDVKIREKVDLDASVHVQLEGDGRYRLGRFFDSGTDQPFLAESAVYEESIQVYIDGVKADLAFIRHLETIRLKQLPRMVGNSAVLKTYQVNPYQADFLNDFGKSERTGYMPLSATEIDELIQLGYLIRDRVWASTERVDLEASIARTRNAMENFEAKGKEHQAAQCRAKVRKLELRIDSKTLSLTPAGKAAVYELPYQVELTSQVINGF